MFDFKSSKYAARFHPTSPSANEAIMKKWALQASLQLAQYPPHGLVDAAVKFKPKTGRRKYRNMGGKKNFLIGLLVAGKHDM